MRPDILNPLFAEARTLAGVGPKIEKHIAKALGTDTRPPRVLDLAPEQRFLDAMEGLALGHAVAIARQPARRDMVDDLGGPRRQAHQAAVGRHHGLRHLAGTGEGCVFNHVADFTVHRHGDLRAHPLIDAHQFLARCMAGDVDASVAVGDHLDAAGEPRAPRDEPWRLLLVGLAAMAGLEDVGIDAEGNVIGTVGASRDISARKNAERVVASIFVNPLQFGANEDLAGYPRDAARDDAACAAEGVDLVLRPSVAEMYLQAVATTVSVAGLHRFLARRGMTRKKRLGMPSSKTAPTS